MRARLTENGERGADRGRERAPGSQPGSPGPATEATSRSQLVHVGPDRGQRRRRPTGGCPQRHAQVLVGPGGWAETTVGPVKSVVETWAHIFFNCHLRCDNATLESLAKKNKSSHFVVVLQHFCFDASV